MQKSHAIANGTYVVAVNRVGNEKKGNKKIEFWGNSMIIDPSGKIIGKLGNKKEGILIREIDYDKIVCIRGLVRTFSTSAQSNDESYWLLKLMGLPLREKLVNKEDIEVADG